MSIFLQTLPLKATPQTPNSLIPPIRPSSGLLEASLALPEKAFPGKESCGKDALRISEPSAVQSAHPASDQSRQPVSRTLPGQAPVLQSRGSSHQVIRPQARAANGSLSDRTPSQLLAAESVDGRGSETPSSVPSPGMTPCRLLTSCRLPLVLTLLLA